jgi:hypothetical protein
MDGGCQGKGGIRFIHFELGCIDTIKFSVGRKT